MINNQTFGTNKLRLSSEEELLVPKGHYTHLPTHFIHSPMYNIDVSYVQKK